MHRLITLISLLSVCSEASDRPGPTPVESPPPSLAPAGEVNATSWGLDGKAIQAAIDSGASRVVVPFVGRDWVCEPLHMRSGVTLVLEPNVVLAAKSGSFKGATDSLLDFVHVRDAHVIGEGATLRMRRQEYSGEGYEPSEWRHTLCFWGAVNCSAKGLKLTEAGGDGVYVGPSWDRYRAPCREIDLQDLTIVHPFRQGISVVSADGLSMENLHISQVFGVAPQAGIDFEPADPRDLMRNIRGNRILVEAAGGSALFLNPTSLDETSAPLFIRVTNVVARRCGGIPFRVASRPGGRPRGLYVLDGISDAESYLQTSLYLEQDFANSFITYVIDAKLVGLIKLVARGSGPGSMRFAATETYTTHRDPIRWQAEPGTDPNVLGVIFSHSGSPVPALPSLAVMPLPD